MRNPDAPQRLRSLDVLRGFAIVGTLGTNIWVFTSVGSDFGRLKENAEAAIATAGTGAVWTSFDSAASALSGVLTNGKFLALLSIMFGVGMAVQFDSARRRGQRWPWRYLWRALLLLADGFVHYLLVVEFDILMGYALTSMVVAPLLLLRTRWLVVATVVAGGVHLALETLRAVQGMASFAPEAMRRLAAGSEYPDMLSAIDGSYLDQVSNRLTYFWEFRVEAFLISPPLSAFLFLCGALLWRSGVFTDAATRRRVSRRLAVLGLGTGFPLSLLPLLPLPGDPAWSLVLGSFDRYTIAPIVAFGYLGLVLVLLERRGGTGRVARRLTDVGRTALSTYMLQNVVASVLFYRWGLGLGPVGALGSLLAWAGITALLMLAAHLWLRRHSQGPFEMVWKAGVDAPFRARDRRRAAVATPDRTGVR
ncbi:MAG TPA: DUF418 domain-containing protein [Pseudonocardia sp.]|nr:DUF418 domain-containing protein [Pseudonocardia sp.]